MQNVVIDAEHTALGERLAALVRADAGATIVAVPGQGGAAEVTDVIVLAASDAPETDGSTVGGVDLVGAKRLLDGLGKDVAHVTVLSSAMVYGAWPDNAVPLTEESEVRPNPEATFAESKAALEQMVQAWAAQRPATTVAVLRPSLTVWPDAAAVDWMERSLWHAASARHGDRDPVRQFLHLDDLATAVDHCRRHRLAGVFNVAPRGWLGATRQIELTGRSGGLRISDELAGSVAGARWRMQLSSTSPDALPYAMHSWVVSSDRLIASGWEPAFSNEEAFVAGHRETWWSSMSARRRQEISLAATAGAIVAVGASVVTAARRWLR